MILKGLKIINDDQTLPLEVMLSNNQRKSILLSVIKWPFDGGWTQNRNICPGDGECVTVFSNNIDKLPLHLKKILTTRDKYWFEMLLEYRALYFQFNSVTNGKEPFSEFVTRMWDTYNKHSNEIEKFIIDIRYNEGGNGELLRPLLHEFIRHEKINQRGKLFIIMGRNTFSAASNFIGQMLKHTNVITVGEPAGPVNWFSDIERVLLPSGRIGFDVSTMYWQEGHALDNCGYCPPEYPVLVTAEDYFSGKDRALEKILNDEIVTLSDILNTKGADAFYPEYKRWSERFSSHEWWFPYTVFDIRKMGVDLFISGKQEDSISILKLNTLLHPDVYWVWEILGNIYENIGNKEQAIKYLKKALELNPYDVYIRKSLDNLSKKD
jgi:tetratricopeptide (TPR) repeat protein